MAVFQDTWKLDIDAGFIGVLGKAEAQLDDLDDSFESVARASKRTNESLSKTEKEAARAAKAMEREAAKAAKQLARDLAAADRAAVRAAKALEKDAAKGARLLARAMEKAERESKRTAKALERDVAKGANAVARAMAKAERETKREALALSRAGKEARALNIDRLTKSVEGLSGAMGIAGVSGETLANGWLAAGVAVGALIASIGALASKSLSAYAKKNVEAKDAVDRLTKAQDRFLVSLGAAIFAEEKGVKALDSFAGRLDSFGAAVTKNKEQVRGFAEGLVDATRIAVKFATVGIQAGLTPMLAFVDLIVAAGGVILNFTLGTIESVIQLLNVIDILPDSITKDLVGITDGVQKEILELTDITEGFTVGLHRTASGVRDFADDMSDAAKGTKDFSGKAQKAEKAVQEFQGPVKTWLDEDLGPKFAGSIVKIASAMDELNAIELQMTEFDKLLGVLDDIEDGLTKVSAAQAGFATEGGFGTGLTGFGGVAERLTKGEEKGLGAAFKDANGTVKDASIDISSELGDFGASGIALATDAMSTFIETMAEGSFTAASFGQGILVAVGSWIGDFGEAMIMAGIMAQFVQGGNLLIAPAAAIGLGIAAVTLGGLMSGLGKRGGGGGGASASSGADAAARRTQRTISDDRSSAEDREDATVVIMMDRQVVGRVLRADAKQSARRAEFVAGHSVQGRRR